MATARVTLKEVEVGAASIERFEPILSADAWRQFDASMAILCARMRGRVVWNINSTARGGGVAELLASLIPYARGSGIDERWAVIEGSPEFFDLTKKIHMLLHGMSPDGVEIAPQERAVYQDVLAANAEALASMVRPGDVVILHDPQTAGLVPALVDRGAHVIWRSHVGIDDANRAVRIAWKFLTPYVAPAAAYVFSRRAYVWDGLDPARVDIIPPCIDPFTPKNADFEARARDAILRAAGILAGADGEAVYRRQDGTLARVQSRASTGDVQLPSDARVVVQVSRWDRLKDPAGVIDGFVEHIAPRTDAWLVLAGPAATSVRDDPEQPEIIADLARKRLALAEPIRRRVVLAQLPMHDVDENAAIVNALQGRADVVVQKSLAEGFGLTVAEAMWKARPVVASRVGGIEDQVEDGVSGILIDDPRDLRAFGDATAALLTDRERATALGKAARMRVIDRFLAPRHLMDQARLIESVL